MSDFFWIGMQLGFGFYCAISVTDLLTEIVKTIINKRKGGEGMTSDKRKIELLEKYAKEQGMTLEELGAKIVSSNDNEY